MTQAFNLSQLANNVNTSGLLNAAAGLYNQVPVANGGTGKASVTSGTLLLGAGTSAMTELTGGTAGNVVTWNGSAWASAAGAGGALQTLTVAVTPGTWTKPATLKGVKVTVVGGGGSGSTGSIPGPSFIGSGGGGGGAAIYLYPAPSLPGPQPYTVGTAGGTSSFGAAPATVITATGGAAGNSGGSTTGGLGGAGSNGNLNVNGSVGGFSQNLNLTPQQQFTGTGGNSLLGVGGAGLFNASPGSPTAVPGNPGKNYGGGGGGARGNGGVGGTGASGVVIIEEFY